MVHRARYPELAEIPGGHFLMGSETGMDNEKPVHCVWVDRFLLAKHPVTNRDYEIFVATAGAPQPPYWRESMFCDPEKPVVGVSWFDAATYCQWLSSQTGHPFRLPTEAEWERAARGGKDGMHYPWGDEPPSARPHPGHDIENGGPLKVGQDESNGFGLCDMSGGVHEWCSDYYDRAYYGISPEGNPQGPGPGPRRASRGGSWRHRVKFSRCAARSSLDPDARYADYGFRVAITA
jgi:formylglycine-generating enzyme